MIKDIKEEYRDLLKTIPESYKVKKRLYNPKSLTEYQIVSLMMLFVSNDKGDGMISYENLYDIIGNANLKFKTSHEEIDELIRHSFNDNDFLNSKKSGINFSTFLYVVDTLKREKLILLSLGNSLNYFIFIVLVILLILYLNLFYSN